MTTPFQEAKALFEDCMDLPSSEWPDILAKASSTEVRAKADVLLRAYQQTAQNFTDIVDAKQPAAAPNLASGSELEDFKIIDALGQGGCGAVYLARQRSIDRMVALKISPKINLVEANVLARLSHPNIVQVYSVAQVNWQGQSLFGICMQFVPGKSLRDIFEDPSSVSQAATDPVGMILRLGQDIAAALAYAHTRELLHLDVKPENILYDGQGKFLLADFNVSMEKNAIDPGRVGGSWAYMPPEQTALFEGRPIEEEALSERSDIYALGRVLAETAKRLGVENSPGLQALVTKATEAEPDDRFQSAEAFLKSICMHLDLHESELIQKNPRRAALKGWALRHPWPAIIGAILLPNLFSSVLQIQYNALHIMSALSPPQRDRFEELLAPVNGVLYLAAVSLIWYFFSPIVKGLRARAGDPFLTSSGLPSIGRAINCMTFFSVVFWGGGFVLFTVGISRPPLTATQLAHFAISFAIALSVGLSLARLLISYLGFTVFYPTILQKVTDVSTFHKIPNIRGLKYSSGLVSMVGTSVVIMAGQGQIDYPVQLLALTFIVGATIGFVVGAEVTDQITASWQTLTRIAKRTRPESF